VAKDAVQVFKSEMRERKFESRGYMKAPPRWDTKAATLTPSGNPHRSVKTEASVTTSNAAGAMAPPNKTNPRPPSTNVCFKELVFTRNIILPSYVASGRTPVNCMGKDQTHPCYRVHSDVYNTWSPEKIIKGLDTLSYLQAPSGKPDLDATKAALGLPI
jgi:hypothetical protein